MLTGTRTPNQASCGLRIKPLEHDKQLTANSHGWPTMAKHPLSAGNDPYSGRNNGKQINLDRDASLYMQNKYHNFPTMMSLARKVVEILNKTKLH